MLLGTGCLAGAVFGLCGQQLLDRALGAVTGFPVVHSVGVGVAVDQLRARHRRRRGDSRACPAISRRACSPAAALQD